MIFIDFEELRVRFDTPARQAWHASLSLQTLASAWGLTNDEMAVLTGIPFAQLERWSWSEPEGWNDQTRAVVRRFQNLQQMLFITQRGWGDYFKRQISLYSDQQRISVLEAARLDREGALKAAEGLLRAGLQ